MKLVSRFLNLLLFVVMFCIITVAQWGVYNIVAIPAEDSKISIVSDDENVAYTDTFRFLGDDLKQSVGREPRYMIRSWFSWDWWQKGMKWADIAAEAVIGVVVPIVSPMYEVNEIKYYYTTYSQTQLAETNPSITENTPTTLLAGTYEGYGVIRLEDYVNETVDFQRTEPDWDIYTIRKGYEEYENLFVYYEYSDSTGIAGGHLYKIKNADVAHRTRIASWVAVDPNGDMNYVYYPDGKWLVKDSNRSFINIVMKINKYNNPDRSYDTWIQKFYNEEGTSIKTSVVALYFQFYMALVLSIWFCYQNPIVIKRTGEGANEVSGGLRFLPSIRRRKRKKNKDKENNE